MIKLFNKTFNLSTILFSIILTMALLIIGLQIFYHFFYGSNFLDRFTFIGLTLLIFSYYNLFLK